VAAGQRLFGENTVQDALTKIPHFSGQGLEWHFIGHLQSNKVRFIPGHFTWVHSLDSVKLALRLARLAREQNTTADADRGEHYRRRRNTALHRATAR
jgi:uncharacterized pyridoxal phosphate-containing UPF0001 family protein